MLDPPCGEIQGTIPQIPVPGEIHGKQVPPSRLGYERHLQWLGYP